MIASPSGPFLSWRAGPRQMLFAGMGRLPESAIVSDKNRSHAISAELEVLVPGPEGVIIAQGVMTGGWSFSVRAGCLNYVYNFLGMERFVIASRAPLPVGTHLMRMEFAFDGGGFGNGGTLSLFLNGVLDGTGRVERTESFQFSADETCDVGDEAGSPVTDDDVSPRGRFTGTVKWVEIAVEAAADDHDHSLNARERWRLTMGLQ